MTKMIIHAFCLDEAKSVFANGEPIELWVGPFDGVAITWDYVRGIDDGEPIEQFLRGESGFWYPVVYNMTHKNGGSMQEDPRRGRFSDVVIIPLEDMPARGTLVPTVQQLIRFDDHDGKLRAEAAAEYERRELAEMERADDPAGYDDSDD